jgi:hypothetical protein
MKPNNFAMKDWHLEHVEKVIVRFVKGLSPDTSSFEKRNHRRYGTMTYCIKQIEYDMQHGIEEREVLEILRKIRLDKKHAGLRSDAETVMRLDGLEDRLSGANKVENVLWHDRAFKDRKY